VACQHTQVVPINASRRTLTLEADERNLWDQAKRVERRFEEVGLLYTHAELEACIHSVGVRLVGNHLENPEAELNAELPKPAVP
jgi:hypothetical protein